VGTDQSPSVLGPGNSTTNREHIIALEPLEKGLVGTLLRYPYEVWLEEEYFDEIQDVKVSKDITEVRAVRAGQVQGPLSDSARRSQLRLAAASVP
jgi:hypothetical protein